MILASKETGLKVNGDKTKYMVMSLDQNGGRSQNMGIDNRSFARVEEFKYLRTALTNQNFMQKEIKSRLKLGISANIRCRIFCVPVYYQII